MDLDKLLDQKHLADLPGAFSARYHVRFPSQVTPSDSLVSRRQRGLELFRLTLADPLTARSLAFDRNSGPTRGELGSTGLTYTPGGSNREISRQGNVDNYFEGLLL